MKTVLQNPSDHYIFYEAEDGIEAEKLIQEEKMDLVILDLMMPLEDGFSVLEHLKNNNHKRDLPVIVYTALDDTESIQKALELGAYDYFTKPLSVKQMQVVLPFKVRNAIRNYEQRESLENLYKQVKQELQLANIFQNSLLPKSKKLETANVFGRYVPCIEVGGDFFDCIEVENRLWFIIADIEGHDVVSAMASSMIKIIFHDCCSKMSRPDEILSYMNELFIRILPEHIMLSFTAFVGMIQEDLLTYANGGHPYPILFKKEDACFITLAQDGYPLGMFREADYEQHILEIEKEDAVLLYTDGLMGKHMTVDKIHDFLEANRLKLFRLLQEDPESCMDYILKEHQQELGRAYQDDIALMFIQKTKGCTGTYGKTYRIETCEEREYII